MELGMKILFKLQCIPLHSFFFLTQSITFVHLSLFVLHAILTLQQPKTKKGKWGKIIFSHHYINTKKHNNGEKFGIYCTRPSFLDNNERYQLSTFSVSFFERIKKNVKNLFLRFRRDDDDDDDDVGQNSKLRNEKQH